MEYSLNELASLLGAELHLAKGERQVGGLASLNDANQQHIGFCASKKFLAEVKSTEAAAVIISPELFESLAQANQNFLLVAKPELSFSVLTKLFSRYPQADLKIHPSAVVHEDAVIGDEVSIGANAVIEQGAVVADKCVIGSGCVVGAYAKIGSNTRLFSNANIYHEVEIGSDCIVHSGAVLGCDGFGFVPGPQGMEKLYQLGTLIIGNRVEIGGNCTIDRGALSNTLIGNGVKLDNQVHIAHNVIIGEHTALAACVGVAGSAKIGAYCQFGGQSGVNGHITICDGVIITGQGFVAKSISEPGVYSSGIPASKNADWRRNASRFHQLNDMARAIKKIEAKLKTVLEKN